MKVVHLAASSHIGGGNRSLLMLSEALRAQGTHLHIVCPGPGPMVEACRERGLSCEVIAYRQPGWREPLRLWQSYREISRLLAAAAPDVVHANDLQGGRFVTLARRRLGLPLVCHIRMAVGGGYASWVFRRLPRPDVFVFNSQAVREESGPDLRRAYPKVEQRVVYNGVDLQSFRPSSCRAHSLSRIGIVANLAPIKGHDVFLRMAKWMLDRGHACEFWIVGTDVEASGYEAHLAAVAADLGISDAVRFLGFRSDVAYLINQLDVVVSSSHYEGFGRTLVEAMACERPVVATAVGGVPEVVEDGVTGFLVPPGDPSSAGERVELLVSDKALRERMGRAGRLRAEALFSVEAHVTQMLDVYRRAVTGGDKLHGDDVSGAGFHAHAP